MNEEGVGRRATELSEGIPDFGGEPGHVPRRMSDPRIPSPNLWQVPLAIAYNQHPTL